MERLNGIALHGSNSGSVRLLSLASSASSSRLPRCSHSATASTTLLSMHFASVGRPVTCLPPSSRRSCRRPLAVARTYVRSTRYPGLRSPRHREKALRAVHPIPPAPARLREHCRRHVARRVMANDGLGQSQRRASRRIFAARRRRLPQVRHAAFPADLFAGYVRRTGKNSLRGPVLLASRRQDRRRCAVRSCRTFLSRSRWVFVL